MITPKWSLVPILESCTGSANILGVLVRHQSSVPVSRVKTLTIFHWPHICLKVAGETLVEFGLKSPTTHTRLSGWESINKSTVFWTWLYKLLLSLADVWGGSILKSITETGLDKCLGLSCSHKISEIKSMGSKAKRRLQGIPLLTQTTTPPPREPQLFWKRMKSRIPIAASGISSESQDSVIDIMSAQFWLVMHSSLSTFSMRDCTLQINREGIFVILQAAPWELDGNVR